MKDYFVYILASESGVLYIGVTNNLERRVYEHQHDLIPGFSEKYQTYRLIYFEHCHQIKDAIAREKQLKSWRREKKESLIESLNPSWIDLSKDPSAPSLNEVRSGRDDKSEKFLINTTEHGIYRVLFKFI